MCCGWRVACPQCSRGQRRHVTKPTTTRSSKQSRAKKLKRLRVVGGKNDNEIIMVSSSDYDTLVETGAYEPVEEETRPQSPAIPMKEVYGKQKSLYKKPSHESPGSRTRAFVKDTELKESEKPDEVVLFEDMLPEENEIHQYLKKDEPVPMDGDEEGWSI